MIFEFDECVLDTSTQELRRAGEAVHVEPQVLAVLTYLVANRDRMVTKIELLDEVWGDRFVSESALTSRIKLARKACGDSGREQRIVKTVHSRGYRFVAPVRVSGQHPAAATAVEPAARAVPTVADPAPSTGLFGRDAEVAALDEVMATVAGGARGAVFVRGRAGSVRCSRTSSTSRVHSSAWWRSSSTSATGRSAASASTASTPSRNMRAALDPSRRRSSRSAAASSSRDGSWASHDGATRSSVATTNSGSARARRPSASSRQ